MIQRPFWLQRLEAGWREAPIVWLSGVRRCGKTTITKSLGEGRALYLNCDLPAALNILNASTAESGNLGSTCINSSPGLSTSVCAGLWVLAHFRKRLLPASPDPQASC